MSNSPRCPQRVHNDLRFRELTVLRVEHISVNFRRIALGGEALDGFTSHDFDDHSKPFFPRPGTHFVPPAVTREDIIWPEGPYSLSRDYTPLYDELHHELAIDSFIRSGGIASGWAMQAKPGSKLTVADPRGSLVVPEDYTYQLYVCNESGMPTLRRRLETLSKPAVKPQISVLVSMRGNACQGYLAHLDSFSIERLAHSGQAVDARLAQMQVPADGYLIQITGKGKVVEDLNRRFETEQYDSQWVRVAAY